MTLYCSPICPHSHQVRFVWHEKGIQADIRYIDSSNPPEDIIDLNPYHQDTFTTLVDRDLVLYDHRIIMEYLDERFPHPPLHPMEPVARAQARMLIHRIDRDWYRLLGEIRNSGEKKAARARKMLREDLLAAAPLFAARTYFLSEEFSLVDCTLAPLLWRLPAVGIDLPREAYTIRSYAQRIFAREGFRQCLSEAEKEMAEYPTQLSA